MKNLTDHRIDGADGLGVERVRCTCSPEWISPTMFTEHIAEIAADTREERVRGMLKENQKVLDEAIKNVGWARDYNTQAQIAAERAAHSAKLAVQAADYSMNKAGMKKHADGTDYPPKRRWWQL